MEATIGLIGGLGVGAAIHYYRELAKAHDRLARPMHLVMVNADTQRVIQLVRESALAELAEYFAGIIRRLKNAGATMAVIPAVTPHVCIDLLISKSELPLVNALEVTYREIARRGLRRVALFGTRYAIESKFFGKLPGIDVVAPRREETDLIHNTYFALVNDGSGNEAQRNALIGVARTLIEREGVEAILLAGTDLALLFDPGTTPFPHVDCAQVHMDAIMDVVAGGVGNR